MKKKRRGRARASDVLEPACTGLEKIVVKILGILWAPKLSAVNVSLLSQQQALTAVGTLVVKTVSAQHLLESSWKSILYTCISLPWLPTTISIVCIMQIPFHVVTYIFGLPDKHIILLAFFSLHFFFKWHDKLTVL